jgi:hypothetical protein
MYLYESMLMLIAHDKGSATGPTARIDVFAVQIH